MTIARPLVSLGRLALVAAVMVPLLVVWLSGRFGQDPDREPGAPSAATLATLPRTDTVATAGPRQPLVPDAPPTAAPSVTIGAGRVSPLPDVAGGAPVPPPNGGTVVGEPSGLPDPTRSEAMPKPAHR